MNICRMLVVAGIVLIQVSVANAQFGDFGNLIKKKLTKQVAPTNLPPVADSNAMPTNQTTPDATTSNPQNTAADASALKLPPIFEAVKNCDDIKFAELLKNEDASSIDMTLYDTMLRKYHDESVYSKQYAPYKFHTLLGFAAENGCTNIIQQLLEKGASIDPYPNDSPIRLATSSGHLDAERMLEKAKSDLEEAEKAKAAEQAEKDAAAQKEADAKAKKERDEVAQKQVLDLINQPIVDLFGMADSRYRKFNGTVYDCAEPIEFLNRLFAFMPVESEYNDTASSFTEATELKRRVEAESKWLHENPWYKIWNDCILTPAQVKQVTPDGLIVRLNSQEDIELLALLKNHPKQKTAVDGDVIAGQLFVIKTSPYQYVDVLGATRTIHSYDMGVIVPAPSGSVPKIPVPDVGQ
jgi:hypothetical protein